MRSTDSTASSFFGVAVRAGSVGRACTRGGRRGRRRRATPSCAVRLSLSHEGQSDCPDRDGAGRCCSPGHLDGDGVRCNSWNPHQYSLGSPRAITGKASVAPLRLSDPPRPKPPGLRWCRARPVSPPHCGGNFGRSTSGWLDIRLGTCDFRQSVANRLEGCGAHSQDGVLRRIHATSISCAILRPCPPTGTRQRGSNASDVQRVVRLPVSTPAGHRGQGQRADAAGWCVHERLDERSPTSCPR